MYNLSVPTQLKAWIDRLCVAGKTFRYTEQGVVGMVPDKSVVIASTRGGIYTTPDGRTRDFQEPYLISIFGLLGIHSVAIVRAEGLDISPDQRALATQDAFIQIDNYFNNIIMHTA